MFPLPHMSWWYIRELGAGFLVKELCLFSWFNFFVEIVDCVQKMPSV